MGKSKAINRLLPQRTKANKGLTVKRAEDAVVKAEYKKKWADVKFQWGVEAPPKEKRKKAPPPPNVIVPNTLLSQLMEAAPGTFFRQHKSYRISVAFSILGLLNPDNPGNPVTLRANKLLEIVRVANAGVAKTCALRCLQHGGTQQRRTLS